MLSGPQIGRFKKYDNLISRPTSLNSCKSVTTATYTLHPKSVAKSYIISVKKMNPGRSMCRTHATWASVSEHMGLGAAHTLCYAILLPGRQSGVRDGLRPNSNRENFKIGRPKAAWSVDSETFPTRIRPTYDPETPFPARMHYGVAEGINLKLRTRPNGNQQTPLVTLDPSLKRVWMPEGKCRSQSPTMSHSCKSRRTSGWL